MLSLCVKRPYIEGQNYKVTKNFIAVHQFCENRVILRIIQLCYNKNIIEILTL